MTALDTIDTRSLTELESVIERGIHTFVEVGNALREIHDRKLYSELGYRTFAVYVDARWGWSRQHACFHMQAADVVKNVKSICRSEPSLTQAIELARCLPHHQREIASRVDFAATTVQKLRAYIREMPGPSATSEPVPGRQEIPVLSRHRRRLPANSQLAAVLTRWEKSTRGRASGIEIHRNQRGKIHIVTIIPEGAA